eukprot:728036_1
MRHFIPLWLIVSMVVGHVQRLANHTSYNNTPEDTQESKRRSNFITGVWDSYLTILRYEANNIDGHVSTLNTDHSKWEVMSYLPSMTTNEKNLIVDGVQLTNSSLMFMMYSSFVQFYDLSVHKFVDKYHYFDHKNSKQIPATERIHMLCVTENVKNSVLFIVASNALLSFDLFTKSWSRQMHGHHTELHRLTAGCSMDLTSSMIYIFGGISDSESGPEFDPTVAKYTIAHGEWNTVPNAFVMQQTDPIQCGLFTSDGCIYCVTANTLYSFDPLLEAMKETQLSATEHMQYYSAIGWNDSCIIAVGTDPTDTLIAAQHTMHCPVYNPPSKSRQSSESTDISSGHRRQLGSWPIIILDSSYTENVTLEAGNIYVVNSQVVISASLIVPDNVTIHFNGTSGASKWYDIIVHGHLLMGTCVNDGTTGVSSNSIRVYNADTSTNRGIIWVQGTGYSVSVCNTNFSHIFWLRVDGRSDLVFGNLAFHGVHTGIDIRNGVGPETVRNSYFYQSMTGFSSVSGGGGIVRNNIFEQVTTAINAPSSNAYTIINNTFLASGGGDRAINSVTTPITIINNTFVGWPKVFYRLKFNLVSHNVFRDNAYVFWEFYDGTTTVVLHNDFIHNQYPFYMWDYATVLDVRYNNFIDNDVAVYFGKWTAQNVSYNNFINNTVIFDVHQSPHQPHCTHNYYGISTMDAWEIHPYVKDVCNGNPHRNPGEANMFYVKWWPWYNDKIDFDALPALPTAYGDNNTHLADCRGPDLYPDLNGTQLSPIWLDDLTLTADKSPYYIIYHTRLDYSLIIEPSVELIFAGSYIIYTTRMGGGVFIGESMCNDAMQYDGIGLYDANTAIHIHGSRFDMAYGSESAYICNANITGGSLVFDLYVMVGTWIDNCEFHDISNYALRINWPKYNVTVKDTLFRNIYYAIETQTDISHSNAGTVLIEHNKFEYSTRQAIYAFARGPTLSIINNTFQNDGTGIAVERKSIFEENNVISDNTFINFETVFYGLYGANYTANLFINNNVVFDIGAYTGTHAIYHNEMINNSIAIQAIHQSSGYLDVKYNNFVANNKAIIFLNGSP